MSIPDGRIRIAIVGAGSPRGKELKEVLEQGVFRGAEVRLFDEDIAVGTLTRTGDEPAIIAAVDESSFEGVKLAFFTGCAQMAAGHAGQARRAGAVVIDLSEDPGLPEAVCWVPALEEAVGRPAGLDRGLARSPSAAAIVAASIAAALARFAPPRIAMLFLRPVSERGQEGIDELERQTVSLLSFKPVSQQVFGAQVAFNLLDAYGAEIHPSLEAVREAIGRDAACALNGRAPLPAIQVIQAPIFFCYAFNAYAELPPEAEIAEIEQALRAVGLSVEPGDGPRPTNMSVAGQSQAALGGVARDRAVAGGYWFWGVADNVKVVAANAVSIAEAIV